MDQFNQWFMQFAPEAFRSTRVETTQQVKAALLATNDLRSLTADVLRANPASLPTLRMSTAPPLAVDRLIGLAGVNKNLVGRLEKGKLPQRMEAAAMEADLMAICRVVTRLLDTDVFPWLQNGHQPSDHERTRAATVVADRLCTAVANPIVRNAQERRQLELIGSFLDSLGYRKQPHPAAQPLTTMTPGTYTFRLNVPVGQALKVNIPVDVVVQTKKPRRDRLPILIEAKSAGDFTNTNKRRK